MMTTVWTGLSTGAIYTLVATGYNIVFVTSGVFNFAYAYILMLGLFLVYLGTSTLALPAVVAVIAVAASLAGVSVVEERVAIRPVKGHSALLVTTIGFATILEGIADVAWGSDPLRVKGIFHSDTGQFLGGSASPNQILLIAAVVVVTILLVVVSRTTLTGLAGLGIAEDREAALLRGVDVRRYTIGAYAVAGALAGILAIVVGPITFAVSSVGAAIALKGFVALAFGGFGSIVGGLVGGLATGLIEAFATRWIAANYGGLIVFGMLLLVLMIKPTGLFGERQERMV